MTARNVNRNLNDKKGGKEQISVLHGDHNALRRYYEEIRALHQVWDSILRKQQDIEIGKIASQLPTNCLSEDELKDKIDNLKNHILLENEYKLCQKQIDLCLQLSHELPKLLKWSSENSAELLTTPVSPDHEVFIQTLNEENNEAVVNYLELLKEIEELDHAVMEKQKQSIDLIYQLRSLYKNLYSVKKCQTSEEHSSESRFQKFVHLFTVICELFQELIMASKVDWSGDEKLQDLVIMLGKPVTF